ncbi:CPBP family intramembrane metalloprotease [Candidatus Aminicenantes bacterium AC-334-K16]|jgi:membrane protease YdiL (CAAX protease family)|nr:CPBP family intramembrane metalloprotease [Candidatus Aminicenantes bacterium AC-334-K16]
MGQNTSTVRAVLPLCLLLLYLSSRKWERLREWAGVFLALLAASGGFLVSWWLAGPLMKIVGASVENISGVALAKLFDCLLVVVPVIVIMRWGGVKPSRLFIRKGKVRLWIIIGGVSFLLFLFLFILQIKQQNLSYSQVVQYAPWILIFILANGFLEELHFRGLLLGPFEPLLGRVGANVCIALFFTLTHAPVTYTTDIYKFLIIVFGLSLAWGWIIQKTESLWGAVLFHAGSDLLVIMSIFETFKK